MRCQHCHADNPEDAMFCGGCGHKLGQALPSAAEPPAPPAAPPLQADPAAPPPPAPNLTGYLPVANTSGTGHQAILPDEANGWSFAGAIPFGIYAFAQNLPAWGMMGCLGTVVWPLQWVYFFVIGASGRQMAWKHRSFGSTEEFRSSMHTWHLVGLACFILSVLYWVIIGFEASTDPSAGVYNIYNQIQ